MVYRMKDCVCRLLDVLKGKAATNLTSATLPLGKIRRTSHIDGPFETVDPHLVRRSARRPWKIVKTLQPMELVQTQTTEPERQPSRDIGYASTQTGQEPERRRPTRPNSTDLYRDVSTGTCPWCIFPGMLAVRPGRHCRQHKAQARHLKSAVSSICVMSPRVSRTLCG